MDENVSIEEPYDAKKTKEALDGTIEVLTIEGHEEVAVEVGTPIVEIMVGVAIILDKED